MVTAREKRLAPLRTPTSLSEEATRGISAAATLRSIGQIARESRVLDNDADYVDPLDMLAELRDDNHDLINRMREVHDLCDEHNDVATASLLENWIDETEKRVWFLFETGRRGNG